MSTDAPTRASGQRAEKARPATPEAQRGSVIAGRFELLRRIGQGAMGEVHEVHDLELDERVALKILNVTPELGDEGLRRLRDEVRLARRITHANVVRIFDIGEDQGTHYFTMQLVTGDNLRERMNGRPLPYRQAVAYAAHIARGLEAAHAAGVLHRDLKPSNVLIAGDRAVVTDFGVARGLVPALPGESSGTPQYMAPEQQEGGVEELGTDLWAFGILLVEMISGERPGSVAAVTGSSVAEQLARRCLSPDPSQRPTARQAAELLEDSQAQASTRVAAFAGAEGGEKSIAVLPPKVIGGELDDALAEALGYEMTDAIARTRGLKVVSLTATAAAGERDPRKIGAAFGVHAVVDITLRLQGSRLRVDTRLVDAQTGFQLWSERLEDTLDGTLAMQEALAAHLAEALRVRIEAAASRGSASADVIERYLRARSKLHRIQLHGPDGAVAELEQVVKEAPALRSAVAALATARARLWFVASGPGAERAALDAVEHSLKIAPDLPESQVAAAALAMQQNDLAQAVRRARAALEAAPTCAAAHELLGVVEGETGRVEAAIHRARQTLELDATLGPTYNLLATRLALLGRVEEAEQVVRQGQGRGLSVVALTSATLRIAFAKRDLESYRRLAHEAEQGRLPAARTLGLIARLLSGECPIEQACQEFDGAGDALSGASARRRAYALQLFSETTGYLGAAEPTLRYLEAAVQQGLMDLLWIQKAIGLDCVRGDPRFRRVLSVMEQRALEVWTEAGEAQAFDAYQPRTPSV
jgi:serine/threonine-protein kinase